jgi:thiol-disulfide isomerase/thioredoxin
MGMRIAVVLVLGALAVVAGAQEFSLSPVEPEEVGDWSRVSRPFRLHPSMPLSADYQGPEFRTYLWGELPLGQARYLLMLGISSTSAGLFVDQDRDRTLVTEELVSGGRGEGFYLWQAELTAEPAGGEPYPYRLRFLWPEGRGYVFLLGGAPRKGEFPSPAGRRTFVLVDGDIDGTFGTEGDFFVVDAYLDDGGLYGDEGGHERFSWEETFTIGDRSFRVTQVAPDGSSVTVEESEYVPPKLPLIPGHPAPNFSFQEFTTGEELSLADFRGQVVLLDFWASWCNPCMEKLPSVLELYRRYHDQGFEIIGISLDVREEDLRRTLEEHQIPWPQAFDGGGLKAEIADLYRVYAIPALFLLDREGNIRALDPGEEELDRLVAELLAEAPAPPPEEPEEVELELPELVAPAEPILELSPPARIGLLPGEESEVTFTLENTSQHLAEEVSLQLVDLPPGVTASSLELDELPGFSSRSLTLTLAAAPDLSPAEYEAKLTLSYHYCIGESCFKFTEEYPLVLAVGEAPAELTRPWNPWWLLVLLGAGLALAWLAWGRGASALSLVLVAVALLSLGSGVYLGQARQAQLIGAVLCTSCVGIEEARHDQPRLSPATQAALAGLSQPVELIIFSTPWCHACPYAKAMLEEFSRANPLIRFQEVNAEEELELARRHGVYRGGRLVVPAILHPPSGRIVFGVEDLEARLLDLVLGD